MGQTLANIGSSSGKLSMKINLVSVNLESRVEANENIVGENSRWRLHRFATLAGRVAVSGIAVEGCLGSVQGDGGRRSLRRVTQLNDGAIECGELGEGLWTSSVLC